MRKKRSIVLLLFGGVSLFSAEAGAARERICINDEWRFHMGDAGDDSTGLIYDVRPDADYTVADAEPTDAEKTARTSVAVLKSWILSSGNRFIQNPWQRHVRTEAAPPCDGAPYVLDSFDDSIWQKQDLTPYYGARSSCFGLIDLDGFRKDRFYLYPSRWRSDFAMAHLLPHWSWPERTGEISPVHLFTSGDEAELFLNGKSLGRKKKGKYECLLRRDEVKYEAGELRAVAYKDGKRWAEDVVKTAGEPCALVLTVDRSCIWVDEKDLAFITVRVEDKNGTRCPRAMNPTRFSLEGPREIVATDHGGPACFVPFPSHERNAFNGLCLAIIKGISGSAGFIQVHADGDGVQRGTIMLKSVPDAPVNQ